MAGWWFTSSRMEIDDERRGLLSNDGSFVVIGLCAAKLNFLLAISLSC
jgi:hypothetical protein